MLAPVSAAVQSGAVPNRPCRRAYDHRLRDLVCEERDPALFPQLGIPRSTVASWIRRGSRDIVTTELFAEDEHALRARVLRLERRVQVLLGIVRYSSSWCGCLACASIPSGCHQAKPSPPFWPPLSEPKATCQLAWRYASSVFRCPATIRGEGLSKHVVWKIEAAVPERFRISSPARRSRLSNKWPPPWTIGTCPFGRSPCTRSALAKYSRRQQPGAD